MALKQRGQLNSFHQLASISLFDVEVIRYYIEYWTIDGHDKLQLVSGCIAIPNIKHQNELNLLVYNHGTATKQAFIPSEPNDPYGHAYALFFSGLHKYITIMPDYLGYGISKHLPHPYCIAGTLGYNSMDALLSGIQLLQKINISNVNTKDIFISGYSEGGIVTMGLLKILETKYSKQFNVAACCPGASPFFTDIKYAIMNPGNNTSTYSAYYFLSLQRIYNVFNSLNDVFNEKYVNMIENELFKGDLHYNEISEKLPKDLKNLFNKRYLNGIMNDTLQNDKLYTKFILKAMELASFMTSYKCKSVINYIASGADLEVPWKINLKFINENKENLYPNINVTNVGHMLDHSNEGKFLVLNMQMHFCNKQRSKLNAKSRIYPSKL